MFFGLASKFPDLMRYWEKAEIKLPTFYNQNQKKKFVLKIRSIAFSILLLALSIVKFQTIFRITCKSKWIFVSVEHLLAVSSLIHFVITCQKDKDPLEELTKVQHPHSISFSNRILDFAYTRFINFLVTFVWSYLDVFIVMISLGLAMHFKLYNDGLKRVKGKVREFWWK